MGIEIEQMITYSLEIEFVVSFSILHTLIVILLTASQRAAVNTVTKQAVYKLLVYPHTTLTAQVGNLLPSGITMLAKTPC